MTPSEYPPFPPLAADLDTNLAERRPASPPRYERLPWKLLGWSALFFALTVFPMFVFPAGPRQRTLAAVCFGISALSALAGVGSAIWGIILLLQGRLSGALWQLAAALVGNGVMAFVGTLASFFSVVDFRRGRQLRSFGKVLLPPVIPGNTWVARQPRIDVDEALRPALARQWRENGRTEHASVAAFARHTLDLLALGAPPSLIAAAQRDALDEIRHAELCFALAHRIDGSVESPGPFPQSQSGRKLSSVRSIALAQVAVDSLLDGALHEGVSARVIAKLARSAEHEAIRALLKELAADEGRHAAHGWDVVEWCVALGGTGVIDALDAAMRALPAQMTSPLPEGARDGAWQRWGIHGHALETAEYGKARAELAQRVGRLRSALKAAG